MKSLFRRLRSFAVAAAIGGLVLNAATPLLASAAAASRGVSPDAICDVYGMPGRLDGAAASRHAMSMHDVAPQDDGDAMAHGIAHDHAHGMAHDAMEPSPDAASADPVDATADAIPQDHDHDHAPGLHHGSHCALTALATFAPPVDASPAPPPALDETASRVLARRDAQLFDAAAHWAARLNRGPPIDA